MNKNPAGLAVLPLLLSLLNSWVCLVPVYTTSASSHEQSKPSAPILLLQSGYWYCKLFESKNRHTSETTGFLYFILVYMSAFKKS